MSPSTLSDLRFETTFLEQLPVDPDTRNVRRQVLGACATPVAPTPVAVPRLRAWSREVAEALGLPTNPGEEEARELAEVLGGNRLVEGMRPYAACYGGHQFGSWAGQLGDGRAITLGEVARPSGARWELQLKGAGPTPYSRMADGRAVLRSSIREFLCSEAMHHLRVPTTRALSLVTTGEEVVRDMFYDGNPAPEQGAIVCRVAPSFVRFGNFEIFAARGDRDLLRRLADYVIELHFPQLSPGDWGGWFEEICRRTAQMVAHWMRVGFVHGVMNTDNMSILGLTIDYGPYGWIDDYDPGWTPNTTDRATRRYRFGHQPQVALWNLQQLAGALAPLLSEDIDPLRRGLQAFIDAYDRHDLEMWAAKLGLKQIPAAGDPDDPGDRLWLIGELQEILMVTPTDMTLFFRRLADVPLDPDVPDETLLAPLALSYYEPEGVTPALRARTLGWLRALGRHVRADGAESEARRAQMNGANPKYVLRNYLAQLAIDDARQGDFGLVHELLDTMRRPYDEQPGRERFAEKRPDWAKDRPGCSMLSCSS